MAEFVGTEAQISIQKRMRDRQSWIARTPGAANGGRVLAFDDPERVGWDKVAELVRADELAAFPMFPKQAILAMIRDHLGPHWKTPDWQVFLGTPESVLSASQSIMDSYDLPPGWCIDAQERPDNGKISAVQSLNAATGVAPYPAFFSRGDAVPIVTVCISDENGELVASASAIMRYHPESRLGGCVFAGMASVSLAQRAKGLGKLVNAAVMVESHARFQWKMAKEQVAADNRASQAMIEACGLRRDEDRVSVAAINSEEGFTR